MTLEQLIYHWFSQDEALVQLLASYLDAPAIFCSHVPDDKQEGWGGRTQYPRICYTLDFQVNAERASVGIMDIAIYCESSDVRLEQLEQVLKQRLKDILMKPEGEFPYCFTWNRTESFTWEKKIIGIDLHFDMMEYASQETTDPDPVMAVNRFIKETYGGYTVLGWDAISNYVNTQNTPLFYCRLESQERAEETNTVVWMNCRMAVHFLCTKSDIRRKVISALAQKILLDGEIMMMDGSPMFIKQLQQNNRSDYLTEGQLYLSCKYGVLRYQKKPHALTEATIEIRRKL